MPENHEDLLPHRSEWEPYVAALRSGDVAAARRALESSAHLRENINRPCFDFGQRATHMAATNPAMLDLLIEFGADIHLKSDWEFGPYSVMDAADEVSARHLMKRGLRLGPGPAARLGWFEELKAIVEADPASVNERGGDGQMPLHQAKTVGIAEWLLDHGAEIDAPCIDHKSTPAQYALAERPEVASLLLDRSARPDIFMAARLGDAELAKKLIEADPKCLAARINAEGYAPVVPFNIYCWTLGFQLSPHEVALNFGHRKVYEFLVERSPAKTRLIEAAMRGDESAARAAIAEEPSLMDSLTRGDHGQLAQAIFFGHFAAAETMLRLGFDPLAPGQDTGTALHMACWMGNAQLVEKLAALPNAPVNEKEPTHGGTPLGWALHGSEHRCAQGGDYAAVVEAMIAAGAELEEATLQGSAAVRDVLKRHGVA